MYSLHLSPEKLQIRDTVRDFVAEVIKPLELKPGSYGFVGEYHEKTAKGRIVAE